MSSLNVDLTCSISRVETIGSIRAILVMGGHDHLILACLVTFYGLADGDIDSSLLSATYLTSFDIGLWFTIQLQRCRG
ncbi:hypothetical protein IW261DRAFT_1479331 [Armillaria novae-zelandiae]|uniref:Uncharacterized protein n=1 Tax=Armillaria novae-zelandiae TaxID=153914 RepID=A0AA39P8C1_9AGAR|nr:hypothetical protein IW261DRAFT_1479331 [Armillaria novae-zelandiae]